jgi:hypothetical protein
MTVARRSRPTTGRRFSSGRSSFLFRERCLIGTRPDSETRRSGYTSSSGGFEEERPPDRLTASSAVPVLDRPMLPPPAPNVARKPNWRGPQPRDWSGEVGSRGPATGLCARGLEDLGNLCKSGQIKPLCSRHTYKMYTS